MAEEMYRNRSKSSWSLSPESRREGEDVVVVVFWVVVVKVVMDSSEEEKESCLLRLFDRPPGLLYTKPSPNPKEPPIASATKAVGGQEQEASA